MNPGKRKARTLTRKEREGSDSEGFLYILRRMVHWLILLLRSAVAAPNARCNLLLENLAVRHQLLVLHRTAKLSRLTPLDRAPWASLGVKSVATTRTQVKASERQRPGRGEVSSTWTCSLHHCHSGRRSAGLQAEQKPTFNG